MTAPGAAQAAIVTGAGRGLGRAYALALAGAGLPVLVNDADAAAAAATAGAITAAGGRAVADPTPVGGPGPAERIVDAALGAFGAVGALVHNAGILRDHTIAKLTDDEIEQVLDVHLRGAVYLCRAAWPHLRSQEYGRIVLISSACGSFGHPGQANYAAAKAGVVGVARTLAFEGRRRNILVNVVAPLAQTEMAGDRFGERFEHLRAEDVAPLVTLLATPQCPVSGVLFTAGGRRVAAQVVAETRGVRFEPGFSAADIAGRLDEVLDRGDCHFPTTLMDDIDLHLPEVAARV